MFFVSNTSQRYILDFLKKISSHHKGGQFICEMLRINVTGLFEQFDLKNQFTSFLKKYIRDNVHDLLENISQKILVSVDILLWLIINLHVSG